MQLSDQAVIAGNLLFCKKQSMSGKQPSVEQTFGVNCGFRCVLYYVCNFVNVSQLSIIKY